MNLSVAFYGLCFVLVVNGKVHGKRGLHGANKKASKLQNKRDGLKGNGIKDLGSKGNTEDITKRQFMFRPYAAPNYPILKPPPIRHFVVHHHASKLNFLGPFEEVKISLIKLAAFFKNAWSNHL